MSVGAGLRVAGLVDDACGPQWTHAGAKMTGLSLAEGIPGPLQVAGLDILCKCAMQVVGLDVAVLAELVQPPATGFAGACEQPPMGSLQAAGQDVSC